MKVIRIMFMKLCSMVAAVALVLASLTVNSTCFFLSYQPDEPTCVREMVLKRKRR